MVLYAQYMYMYMYVACMCCLCPCRILMVNPRDHRVVVVESLLCPTHFRNTLARVLFNHLNVSPLLAGLTDHSLNAAVVCAVVMG